MRPATLSILLLMLCSCSNAQQQHKFDEFCNNFAKGYKALNIPDLQLSYAENLKQIQSPVNIQKQIDFFEKVRKELKIYAGFELTIPQHTDFDLIEYETNLNLERLALEKKWIGEKPSAIATYSLYSIPDGKAWYSYFLKKWTGANVNPDEVYLNGMEEVENVKKHIEEIRLQTGMNEDEFYNHLNDSSFFISSQTQVQQAFEQTKKVILKNLSNIFNPLQIPEVSIQKGADESLAQTPGYYNDNTFYYNYFNKPYNKRQVDWLFIHEAIPGHHYQLSIEAQAKRSVIQQLFHYAGFAEGWAAYTETLGKELGVYQTLYDELGKWEWDLVRSVRVPLDVGINYYGWSDDKALAFWKEHIRNQDDIAMREINRMKRWPAQVVTYKYGAAQIIKWKEKLQAQQGANFNIKTFHDKILSQGSLPFFIVERNLFRKN